MKKIFIFFILAFVIKSVISQDQARGIGIKQSVEAGYSQGFHVYNDNKIFNISILNGYNFGNNFSVSLGIGLSVSFQKAPSNRYSKSLYNKHFNNYFYNNKNRFLLPLFIRLKYNLSYSKVSPFLFFDPGYTILLSEGTNEKYGFRFMQGMGIDIKMKNSGALYFQLGFILHNVKIKDREKQDNPYMVALDIRVGYRHGSKK